jgi:hypothetical protein
MTTPVYAPASPLPFDVAAASAAIDRAAASLHADEHAALTVQLDERTGFGAGLVVRGPWRTEMLGTLTKPNAGAWGWSVGARVSFLVDSTGFATLRLVPPPTARQALGMLEPDAPSYTAPTFLEWFELFRLQGGGAASSALRALRASQGQAVPVR